MRAVGLTLVLILAKVLVLAGRDVTWSWWAIPAYFWHDVAVGAAFGLFETVGPAAGGDFDRRTMRSSVYAALNVPVARALSSPLTMPMWRAAGGPLLDSIAYYLTLANIGAMLLVIGRVVAVRSWRGCSNARRDGIPADRWLVAAVDLHRAGVDRQPPRGHARAASATR